MSFNMTKTGIAAAMGAALLANGAFAQTTTVRTETREVRTQVPVETRTVAAVGANLDLPTDTLVRIKLLDTIDSKNWKEGDQFPYQIVQDVIVDGRVAIPAGTKGAGVISRAREAGSFGKEGKIELSFGAIQIAEGRTVELQLSDKARQGNEKNGLAAGASLAGLAVAGPVGLIGGLFIKGKNVTIPAGSEMLVATAGTVTMAPGAVRTTTRVTHE